MVLNKEVFVHKFSNVAEITAGLTYAVDVQDNANKSDYLPHNKLRIFNKSSVEIFVYLDAITNAEQPDYIIPAGSGIDESVQEGVNFNQVFIKNTDGATAIAIDELKGRIASVREIE